LDLGDTSDEEDSDDEDADMQDKQMSKAKLAELAKIARAQQQKAQGRLAKASGNNNSKQQQQPAQKKEHTKRRREMGRDRRAQEAKEQSQRGVLYIGHLPYGFFEEQLKDFFSQFGEVTRHKLARNRRGRSKHYGFVEFAVPEVAAIAADTMNRYLLFERTLVCEYLAPSRVHPRLFDATNTKFKRIPWRKLARHLHNKPRTAEQQEKRLTGLVQRQSAKRRKLEAMGIAYTFPGYSVSGATAAAAAAPKQNKKKKTATATATAASKKKKKTTTAKKSKSKKK
jgi:nucleolar protein 15